ncbi:Plasmid stabilization system protein ParE [Devosia sp. YR412]|uniref:type II toxin-antitoxin system RelE/ParE family toxin n=1 Tax=Devosia sp. YR412 TaxID=1881030 RepID=UPI0008BFAC51|nr:type II toxin-antitoxin system RelE/ParE family toxin [Devosia sp. YR412]SEQ29301.1 Plasmid stabilization system protein ParE [Devosia sp. YR412]
MRVAFSTEARRDLRYIAVFISADSLGAAFKLVGELETACLGLADHPQRYELVPGFEHLAYRRRPLGNYAIIYAVSDTILIVRVLHSAMDLSTALGD